MVSLRPPNVCTEGLRARGVAGGGLFFTLGSLDQLSCMRRCFCALLYASLFERDMFSASCRSGRRQWSFGQRVYKEG